MSKDYINRKDLEKERTASELLDWLIQKVNQTCSTKEGLKDFRLQKGLFKQLVEEIRPLAVFGNHRFGDTDQVFLQPVIGNQNYDARVIDKRTQPVSESYIEITQAHEGDDDYSRRVELLNKGFVPSKAPVIKEGKGKSRTVSIPLEATSVEEGVKSELNRIINAAKRKASNDHYPPNTSLIIFFDDTALSEERLRILNYRTIDSSVKEEVMKLDLRFSCLYLVGEAKGVFREYPINRLG